jgi:hypothetical protein
LCAFGSFPTRRLGGPLFYDERSFPQEFVRGIERALGDLCAGEHARDLGDALFVRDWRHGAFRHRAFDLFRHDEVPVRKSGNRRKVRDAQDLMVPRNICDRTTDAIRDRSSDARIDFVKHVKPRGT